MKRQKTIRNMIIPLLIPFFLYLVFYSKINIKPTDADFWFVFMMGASFGVALTLFFQMIEKKSKE